MRHHHRRRRVSLEAGRVMMVTGLRSGKKGDRKMETERVRPLRGSSFDSFEDAVLQAIASGSPETRDSARRFNVVQLFVEVGGFVGRPQFFADVAPAASPNV